VIPGNVDNTEASEELVKELEGGTKLNVSPNFNKTKEFDGFRISNIQFIEKDGRIYFNASITNISNEDKEDYTYFSITIFDKEQKEITTIPGFINPVKRNQTMRLSSEGEGDVQQYIYASDFTMKVETKN